MNASNITRVGLDMAKGFLLPDFKVAPLGFPAAPKTCVG